MTDAQGEMQAPVPPRRRSRTVLVAVLVISGLLLGCCLSVAVGIRWAKRNWFPAREDYAAIREPMIPSAKMIANGTGFSVSAAADGRLLAWTPTTSLESTSGFLGSMVSTPVVISPDRGWKAVTAGHYHAVALKADGTMWGWGGNGNGQVGDGTNVTRTTPVRIGEGNGWVEASAEGSHSVALRSDGTLWSWGVNDSGQLGSGDTTGADVPTRIGSAADWAHATSMPGGISAVKSDGSLWACGADADGLSWAGPSADKTLLTRIGTDSDWAAVAGAFALKRDGSLWTYPYVQGRWSGPATRGLPTRIGREAGFTSASTGAGQSVAVKSNGTLWAWGLMDEVFELLGAPAPVQVVGAEGGWASVAADPIGHTRNYAIKSDGSVWRVGFGKNHGFPQEGQAQPKSR